MQVFSFRAKAQSQCDAFIRAANQRALVLQNLTAERERGTPHVEVEFHTTASAFELNEAMDIIESSHGMRATLRPVTRDENPMTFAGAPRSVCA
jgi:hypothetical protein